MPDDRKRRAFLGRSKPVHVEHSEEGQPANQRPYPSAVRPQGQEVTPQRQRVRQQMAPARRKRLTGTSGFASAVNTPIMDDSEVEAFVSAAEQVEPGSMIRPGQDTNTVQIGGPGFKKPPDYGV